MTTGKSSGASIYWFAVIMPLTMIFVSFVSGGWSWGLMQDTTLVNTPGGIGQRFTEIFFDLLGDGRLQPVSIFHDAVFFKIFASNPGGFYIFRWFEVVFALGIWAFLSYRLTGEKAAAPLFFTVALSFYKIYDGFFYLSIDETIGVFFSGLACFFIFTGVQNVLDKKLRLSRGKIFLGVFFLLAALGVKETFIAVGVAIGMTFLILSFNRPERKMIMWMGSILLSTTVFYALFIKFFISKGYSAAYSLTDMSKITGNIMLWVERPLLFHLPWIVLTVILMVWLRNKKEPVHDMQRWAVCLGATLYMAYALIILPWSTWGHYSLPLGVFFAFLITVLIAGRMQRIDSRVRNVILWLAMFYCAFVSWTALRDQYTYQRDTTSLVEWIAQNPIFEHDIQAGAVVRGNADEPCIAIPVKVRMLYNKNYPFFVFTSSVPQILADPQTRYYLWGRYWGDQDLRLLGHGLWAPMFVSENWVMFRRMY